MRCNNCGAQLQPYDRVCGCCGAPLQTAQRKLHITRVAAPSRTEQPAAETTELPFAADKKQRKGDILYGIIVTILVLMALVSATLCVLLLTRGPDPDKWFEKQSIASASTASAALPTPVGADISAVPQPTIDSTPTPTSSPTPTAVPTPTPSPMPTVVPTPTPTSALTSAAEGKVALAELLLEGIERDYSKDELEDLSEYELSILRNGMYAYSGLSFRKSQFKEFFGDCDWYEPNTSDDEKVYERFNSHQKKNVETILSIEKAKGYR